MASTDQTASSLDDTSAMAADIADLMERADPTGFPQVADIYRYGDGHAFNVLTGEGRAFRIAVTEIEHSGRKD